MKPGTPFIILPLYIYPTAGAWDPLYNTLSKHPQLPFIIVINPASGPGEPPYPNSDYITAITKLRSYPNATLLGYVHTMYGSREETAVNGDIDVYHGWKDFAASDISIDGIFFDEAPSSYTSELFSYMSSICHHARNGDTSTVVLNPGVLVDGAYYSIADLVVGFEQFHDAYSLDALSKLESPYRASTCILIHHFSGTEKSQADLVKDLVRDEFGGLFISTEEYHSWSGLWEEFGNAVASCA
ncbi:hypothetical protein BP6252_09545 [Coleophoma cylindrospora]|uniref:Uncharacterized protein n=1 Tax=Coleophoma cylindrospora TaxID=1849047 RepID=A0A3D8R291_9HELO|nr:hypothetical protein BP6252_09545 [Coleophoma cylindrospora]